MTMRAAEAKNERGRRRRGRGGRAKETYHVLSLKNQLAHNQQNQKIKTLPQQAPWQT